MRKLSRTFYRVWLRKAPAFPFSKGLREEASELDLLRQKNQRIEELLKIPEVIDLDSRSYFVGKLLVVPTPLGNLRDLSLKAFDALSEAEVIICEDTRVTGKLFELLRVKNLDQDIKEFDQREATTQDDLAFDYLASLRKVEHKNLVGVKRLSRQLRDFMQQNDVHETKQLAQKKLQDMDSLGFLQKYNQPEEEGECLHQHSVYDSTNKKSPRMVYGLDSEYIKFIKQKIEESRLKNKRGLLISANKFTEEEKLFDILNILKAGIKVCLVSDSGSPCISDPGHLIINQAMNNNIMVQSLPGPNAVNLSLTSSGFPADQFFFLGYLPKHAKERDAALEKAKTLAQTAVFFENKHRVLKTLQALERVFGKHQQIFVGVELTKLHERQLRGSIEQVYEVLNKNPDYTMPSLRGEITVVVAPPRREFNQKLEAEEKGSDEGPEDSDRVQISLTKTIEEVQNFMEIDRHNLVLLVQKITGLSKNKVFGRVVSLERRKLNN